MTDSSVGWGRVKELFGATFEAGAEERRRLLDLHAAEDPLLRSRVESLLQAHDEAGGVLDQPVVSVAGAPPLVGRTLGPYRVVREIGRGGMGAVYEAVREDAQFDQRVAIKTLGLGADNDAMVHRFRQERRILAGLQHPNIAPLYDGGVTEEGLPYFVLEYVDGQPIDQACATRRLDLRARLDLFRQVVIAVQYAHRRLIIHRDLKPGNILVTGEGVVKLVDFGIAKLLEADGPEVTGDLRAPLTLSSASPEQVKGEVITTATDVYSLGVVLYRLFTGRNPINLDSLSLDRAVHAICEEVPLPPSQTVTAEWAAGLQSGSLERVRRELSGELDAIVMMALRKEPDRRYPTALALGDDLQRYLKGLPVAAAPDTFKYRAGKFIRRRKGLVLGAGLAVVSLIGGAGIALWQARAAREEARRATQISRFLQEMIGSADVSDVSRGARLGPGATVAELLDSAARRVPSELQDDPEVRSAIHYALGRSYNMQERWRDALAQFDSSQQIIARAYGERRTEVARALAGMAEAEAVRGGPRADSIAARATELYRAVGDTESTEYAHALRVLALSKALLGDWASAGPVLRRSLEIQRRVTRLPTAQKALTLADLTAVEEMLDGDFTRLQAGFRTALAMFDSIPGSEVAEKGEVLWYAARLEASAGRIPLADSLSLEGLRVYERVSGPLSQKVAQQLTQLSGQARARGDTAGARAYVTRAMHIIESRPEIVPLIRERVLIEYALYLWTVRDLGRADSAIAAAYRSRLEGKNSPYILEAGQLYGAILREEKRFPEAESVLLDAWKRARALYGPEQYFPRLVAGSLVRLYYGWQRPDAASPYLAVLPDSVQRALKRELSPVRRAP